MKKSLVLMAVAGVALAGCVNDVAEVTQNQEQKKDVKIKFERPLTYNNVSSRANVMGLIGSHKYEEQIFSYPREESFIIYAVAHEKTGYPGGWSNPYGFNGDSIKWDKDLDAWAPITKDDPETDNVNEGGAYYFWPHDKNLSFAATSPATLYCDGDNDASNNYWDDENLGNAENPMRSYGADGLTINNFIVCPDAAKQYDLLFSERSFNCTYESMTDGAGDYNGIPLIFQHALSSIRFSFKKAAGLEQTVLLKKIELFGVRYEGTFKENIDESSNPSTYVRGVNVSPEWTFTEDQNRALISEQNAYVAFESSVGVPFPSGAQYVSTAASGIAHNHNYLLLLPQDLPIWSEDDPNTPDNNETSLGAAVKVTYCKDGDTDDTSKIIGLRGLEGIKNSQKSPVNKWEIGHQYIYRLVIGGDAINAEKIYFAPSTENWTEVTAIEVHI